MVYEYTSYRDYLKSVLIERKQVNPAYSLRAFALNLGFSGSQLSEAMSGKANFSLASLRKIAKKLKLDTKQTDYLCLLGSFEGETNPEARAHLLDDLQRLNPIHARFSDLSVDHFKQISDWYHSAIAELVSVDGFELTPLNAARAIGISKEEAELAIDRLVRLGLLIQTENGYAPAATSLKIRAEEKNAALRLFYRQMFEKASQALDHQSPQQRWSGSETLPISREALPELRAACDAFCDEIVRLAKKHEQKDDIYHLSVQFFSLMKDAPEAR